MVHVDRMIIHARLVLQPCTLLDHVDEILLGHVADLMVDQIRVVIEVIMVIVLLCKIVDLLQECVEEMVLLILIGVVADEIPEDG